MDTTTIGVEITTVESLISDNCYRVPSYQRHYSWSDEALIDFWDDLVDVTEEYQDSHFIGQIVTYVNDNVQEVIDGQQRLTTISILLGAILNKAHSLLDNVDGKPKTKLDAMSLNIEELLRWNDKSRLLVLQEYKTGDNSIDEYFRGIFEGKTELSASQKSIVPVKKISDALHKFEALIDDYFKQKNINDNPEKVNTLYNIYKSLKNKFILSKVSTRKKEEAYIIYQSLNSKGTPLKASELIKSHIMLQVSDGSEDEKEKVRHLWDEISTSFGNDSDKITKFIRVYWSAVKRVVTENQLFRSISQEISGKNKTLSFLDNLTDIVDYYVAMENGISSKKDQQLFGDKTIITMLVLMKKMKISLHYPIVFSMILRGTDVDTQRVVIYKVLSIFIRHRTICYYGTNSLEKGYAKVAQLIWNQRISSENEINSELGELLVKNVDVKNSFRGLSKELKKTGEGKWSLVYIMLRLYKEYGDFEDIELSDIGLDKLAIIHINKDIDNDYLDHIGNYALVEESIKQKYEENDVYRSLSESRYSVNNSIAEKIKDHTWDVNDVLNRQDDMSDKVVDIW